MREQNGRRDIIVIGGSAGALEAMRTLVSGLPKDLGASILVTLHISSDFPSILPELLSRSGHLPARHPADKDPLEFGVIYVAIPDHHLLVEKGRVRVTRGPRENRHRPAIDPLFRSAARAYGPRVVGVILSGQLDDGSAGLTAIKMRRGLSVVQDPRDAFAPEMPSRAIQYAGADFIVPVAKIPSLLAKLTCEPLPAEISAPGVPVSDKLKNETRESDLEDAFPKGKVGKPSSFACPECHGVLWETEKEGLLRFRCRVGHAYTADALRVSMSESTEDALWAAMRVLEEKSALLRRMVPRFATRLREQYQEEARGYDQHAQTIREILVQNQGLERMEQETESHDGPAQKGEASEAA